MNRKTIYLILTIIGFLAPKILVVQESIETGNILLYTHVADTFNSMFANRISSIFTIDLLFAVLVFLVWSFFDAQKSQVRNLYVI